MAILGLGASLPRLPAPFLGRFVPPIQKVTPKQVRAMSKKIFLS